MRKRREWDDHKAHLTAEVLQRLRPGWGSCPEFQAVVEVNWKKGEEVFVFGTANGPLDGDVYENAKCQEDGCQPSSVLKDVCAPDELIPEEIAARMIARIEDFLVGKRVSAAVELGQLAFWGAVNEYFPELKLDGRYEYHEAAFQSLREMVEEWAYDSMIKNGKI